MMAVVLSAALVGCSSSTDSEPTVSPSATEEGSAGTSVEEPTETGNPSSSEDPTTEELTVTEDPDQDSTSTGTDETGDEGTEIPAFGLEETQSESFPNLLGEFHATEGRVGGHENFDRVVIEYDGTEGELNWAANYEEAPIQDGSGFEVDMEGTEFLTIWVSGVRYPTEDEMTEEEFPISGLDQSSIIQDVHVDGPFEGMHTIFIGTDEKRPYRVQVFDDPTRIVVDIEK